MRLWGIIVCGGTIGFVEEICGGKIRGKYVRSKQHTDTRWRFTIQGGYWLKSTDVVKLLVHLSVEQDRMPEASELSLRIVD